MHAGDVETFHQDDMWHNKIVGQDRPIGSYVTKVQAVDEGRDVARAHGVEHVIRKPDGTIGERYTYGHDLRDIPG